MVRDFTYSIVELERFLTEHNADDGIMHALRNIKHAIYDYQIMKFGLQPPPLQNSTVSSKSAKWVPKSHVQMFLQSILCACSPTDNSTHLEDDASTSLSVGSETQGSRNSSITSVAGKGWTIGESARNTKIDYNDEKMYQEHLKQLGRNWNLDIIALSNFKACMQNGPIVCVGRVLIDPVGERIHPDFKRSLTPLLSMIQDVYLPNPYHNALHGACVAHMTAVLTKALGLRQYLTPIEEFAYLIAALGHDAGHPGKTNAFLRSTQNPLALIYNDTSILENYHASLVCHILKSQEWFLKHLSQQDWENVRRRIIQLVLATDMMSHFTHVNNVKDRRLNGTFDYKKNAEDLWYLMVLCIKMADIGHNFLPWCDHLPWTKVLFDEFHMQGDEERLLSMPLLLFFDRSRSADIPDSQLGFFQGFTMPLMEELTLANPESEYIKRYIIVHAHNNLENWKKYSKRSLDDIAHELESSDEVAVIEDAFVD
ncbi:putative 3'5'-cyclic nucleotide phosphodiesterase [Babesia divergens]|uniref:3'5'-cyclic nucleotide phosphodiesterase n=1 Tax=Babesia divergens TaxID=32595 RepID=A0AAD9LH99_BABDI|nr:putative 3'5'-cyclic nucleotide phosphodiesterase [Babesia divergens]